MGLFTRENNNKITGLKVIGSTNFDLGDNEISVKGKNIRSAHFFSYNRVLFSFEIDFRTGYNKNATNIEKIKQNAYALLKKQIGRLCKW